MKLIKLTDDHYIVVADSEITQACYVYKSHENVHGRGVFYLPADTDFVAFNKEAKDVSVITHSTQPMPHGAVRDLNYWRSNAEEDYLQVPISVLRYISALEIQQERMYSEEDMEKAFTNGLNRSFDSDFDRWFENFKKN